MIFIVTIRSHTIHVFHLSAPENTDSFRSIGQNKTSITLQWNAVNTNSFILHVNGTWINIPAPDGNKSVTYTVSNLTTETLYTFTLFTVLMYATSNGVTLTAATGQI